MTELSAICVGLALWVLGQAVASPRASLLERRVAHLLIPPSGVQGLRPWNRLLRRCAQALDGLLGGSHRLEAMQGKAGMVVDPAALRCQQVLWGIAWLIVSSVVAGLVITTTAQPLGSGVALGVMFIAVPLAVWAPELVLRVRAERRRQRILGELPVAADVLALATLAGEGPVQALERASSCVSGPLRQVLQSIVHDVRAGNALIGALESVSGRIHAAALTRFLDAWVVALERGAPLADMLRAQAGEVRVRAEEELARAVKQQCRLVVLPCVLLTVSSALMVAWRPR